MTTTHATQTMAARAAFSVRSLVALMVVGGLVAGCARMSDVTANTDKAPVKGEAQAATTQFTDIPIPGGFSMDMDKTRVYGGGDTWYGQLVLDTPHAANEMFDFYKAEMPGFGWREITSIRAATSFLTFSRQGRVATIQISERTIKGATVTFSVSPEGSTTTSSSSGRRAPVRTAPVKR